MHAYPVNWALAHGDKSAGSWQSLTASSPFGSSGGGTEIQMTDGTILVNDNEANWYRLTPDQNGSYLNGTWTQAATLPSGYGPLYFASAILTDGKLLVEGGEYNFLQGDETNKGAIYDPIANKWTSVSPPSGWSQIGDASSVILPNGTFMLGNCCGSNQALFNEGSLSWTTTGTGKHDANSEEGWTLLANGLVLTADVLSEPNSELYNPTSGSWSTAGNVPANLTLCTEMGPNTLRPDGTTFLEGANGKTAIYNSTSGTWSSGPSFPIVGGQQLGVADGPASLLPNGRVLTVASPGCYNAPSYFFEWTGKKLISVPAPSDASGNSSYTYRLLVLPTGQVLATGFDANVEVFTSKSKKFNSAYRPTITSVPTTLTHGQTYTASGVLFNGLSQANFYGDDDQQATNFPLVRITNNSTSHVFYARTHGFSSMAVNSAATVSTSFDVPAGIETGPSSLVVVANGIASLPTSVTVN